jgi:hypothetical protein
MYATLWLISRDAYEAGAAGNLDGMTTIGEGVQLDKTWHAIHYLISGDSTLRFLSSGIELAEVSEPCEVHSPDAISELWRNLRASSAAGLVAKFDADAFNALNIYQTPWDTSGGDYIKPYLDDFLAIVRQAAEGGYGLLAVIA